MKNVLNWSDFSIDPAVRLDKHKSWFSGDRDVNPDGKITYGSYLDLQTLLSAQTPGTRIPDERVFIITHQICELAFKQMLFDLEVLAKTFREAIPVAKVDGIDGFRSLDFEFWRPALTAAGRLSYSASKVLPGAVGYLAYNPEPTFDSIEFGLFREKLIPASGFQSAQFRAIQAGLGKRNMLDLQMYPSAFYRQHYRVEGKSAAVSPSDPLIVQSEIPFGSPTDDLAHELLRALAGEGSDKSARMLSESDFEPALLKLKKGVARLRRSAQLREAFGDGDPARAMVDTFRASAAKVIEAENIRRMGFVGSGEGVERLLRSKSGHPLSNILQLLQFTDDSLHGLGKNSFLSLHRRFVGRRINEVNYYATGLGQPKQTPGTGGGGMPYLELMHKNLAPLFPGLVGII